MSKNIKLNNTNYTGVSTVQLPTVEGGTATFKDTDEITTPSENSEAKGILFSDFTDTLLPQVVDARSMPVTTDAYQISQICYQLFACSFGNGLYTQMRDVYLPDGLKYLSNEMFVRCAKLANIYGDLTTVTHINNSAFSGCTNLKEFPYVPNVTHIDIKAFLNCTSLTEVKLYKKPTVIHAQAFNGCTAITDIYVPWAEGEVADAPWGATNATIHYNTTYDENHEPIV